jgi:hypothetical protein
VSPRAPGEPVDVDDLAAMVSSLDQFASQTDDDEAVLDALLKDSSAAAEPLPPIPRQPSASWIAAGQSKPVPAKPRSNAVLAASGGGAPATPASPALTRTARVPGNLAPVQAQPIARSAPSSGPSPRPPSKEDAPAPLVKQNTLGKLGSKLFSARQSTGSAPNQADEKVSPRSSAISPRGESTPAAAAAASVPASASASASAELPLTPLGKADLDEATLATADRYRKMSVAIQDLVKKEQQLITQHDQHAQLVGKVLQKAEKQTLAPAPLANDTAGMVTRLSELSVAASAASVAAFGGMSKTVDTIDSVRASLKQQTADRERYDANLAKFIKERDKAKKSAELPDMEKQLRAERERLLASLVVCESTMREVADRREDITTGFLSQLLDSLLAQARAQAALVPELEKLSNQARGLMLSGDEKRRITAVFGEADDALVAASTVSGVTDQAMVQIAEARGALIRERAARITTLVRQASKGRPTQVDAAIAQALLVNVLTKFEMAGLNALCVAGRNNESVLLEHLCNALDATGQLLQTIEAGVTRVVATSEHEQTLFRSNTETTKLIGAFTKLHGLPYLQQLLVPFIERLRASADDYEVNPTNGSLSDDVVAANSVRLRALTAQFFAALAASADQVPPPLRAIAAHLHREVGKRYPDAARSAVGGYICLRFVCPAMMTPRAFGVVPTDPPAKTVRALTLVGKIVQNVANGIEFKKEAFMVPFNDCVATNQALMNAFLDKVIQVPQAKLDAVAPLATKEQAAQRDVPALHYFMASNIGKMTKTMCDYKNWDAIAPFCGALSDAGAAPTTKPPSLQ